MTTTEKSVDNYVMYASILPKFDPHTHVLYARVVPRQLKEKRSHERAFLRVWFAAELL